MSAGIEKVASNALKHFARVLHPQAVRIFTPFTNTVPLAACEVSPDLKRFLIAYEPKVERGGLFPHQEGFFRAYAGGRNENFLITTATGSGKSLCFWSWVFDRLSRNEQATALLCFPTQALMWGQAERLARVSDRKLLARPDGQTAYAGAVKDRDRTIGWTIWHGKGSGATYNPVMAEHEKTAAFKSARIRIATLDKAHWSLFRGYENKHFASRLSCLVIDEAHGYGGVFGANVHYFLKRLYLGSQILGRRRPGLFLASATLSSARKFAATLLSLESEAEIAYIEDSTRQEIELIPTADVPRHLGTPPANGLLRVVLLLNCEHEDVSLLPFMGGDNELGTEANAVFFSPSKYQSKRLKLELETRRSRRSAVVYDADLPPHQRREMERTLNDSAVRGTTVLATSALELGVDIEGLDVCFIDQVPPSRTDLLQRIGRVGRRVNRPGLVLLRISAEPQDQHILEDPCAAFRLDLSQPLPIPLHLDMLRWKHVLAAYSEWEWELSRGDVSKVDFSVFLRRHFGESWSNEDLVRLYEYRYGSLVNMEDPFWVHQGFRASTSQAKIPLKEGQWEVARIEDIAIFRDAHPEAVFLGHDLTRYRVRAYEGDWQLARGEHPGSEALLGKWLRSIKAVQVARERKPVTTRGSWEEWFNPYEIQRFTDEEGCPRQGCLEFGVWDYVRKWQGYIELNLGTNETRWVPLAEVTQRLNLALQRGDRFPFLQNFSYRTQGWHWDFGTMNLERLDSERQWSLGNLVANILAHFLADVAETRVVDVSIRLDLPQHQLQVLDSTPGGNGLSETLLTRGRIPSALRNCIRTLSKFEGKGGVERFSKYVLALCHEKPDHTAEEVMHVVGELQERWTG
jgi:DEAD/DEAH box helicase domain-containing protein